MVVLHEKYIYIYTCVCIYIYVTCVYNIYTHNHFLEKKMILPYNIELNLIGGVLFCTTNVSNVTLQRKVEVTST